MNSSSQGNFGSDRAEVSEIVTDSEISSDRRNQTSPSNQTLSNPDVGLLGVERTLVTDEFRNQVRDSLAQRGINQIKNNPLLFVMLFFLSSLLSGLSFYSMQNPQILKFTAIPFFGLCSVAIYQIYRSKKMARVMNLRDSVSNDTPPAIVQAEIGSMNPEISSEGRSSSYSNLRSPSAQNLDSSNNANTRQV